MRLALTAALVAGVALASPAAAAPGVAVRPGTTGLDPAGQTLTVDGSGFDRDANGGVGIYVVFGPKGSDYATNAERYQAAKWVRSSSFGGSGEGELRADGTFHVTLPDLKAKYTDGNGELVDCFAVQCLVMTFTAHGVPDRGNDTFTPVTFATGKPAPVGKATIPYRPSSTPAPSRSAATPAPPAASGEPVTAAPTTAPAATTPTAPAPSAAGAATPATTSGTVAAPVPIRRSGSTAAPVAGVVVAGLGSGAAVAFAIRKKVTR